MPGPAPAIAEIGASLDDLRAAIRAQTRLDIAYDDQQGRRTRQIVWPLQLGLACGAGGSPS